MNTEIKEVGLTIRVLYVDNRKMSRAFLDQIVKEQISSFNKIDDKNYIVELSGKPIGWVKYGINFYCIWQKGQDLRICDYAFHPERREHDISHIKNQEVIKQLLELKQIFIGG